MSTLPALHMNGTAPSELLREQREVRAAIGNALQLLRNAWPNGRDYRTPADHAAAQREYRERLTALETAYADVTNYLNDLSERMLEIWPNGAWR